MTHSKASEMPDPRAQMDVAAESAEAELDEMLAGSVAFRARVLQLAAWWEAWYKFAGHKRLGKILRKKHKEGV